MIEIEGYLGGKLRVDPEGHATAFFCERFVTGCPCDVPLGPVVDALLALKPDEWLARPIAGMDGIYARIAPDTLKGAAPGEVVLYFLSSYRHSTNMVIVSQEKLRQAVQRALLVV